MPVVGLAAALVFLRVASAQEVTPSALASGDAHGLSLAEVLQRTLTSNPEIQSAAQAAEAARGALIVAAAPFDLQVASTGAASRVHTPGLRGGPSVNQEQLAYAFSAQRRLRNGIVMQPDVGLTRTGLSTLPGAAPSNAASVGLTTTVPLLRDRGGAVSAASERAARHDLESSVFGAQHTIALRLLSSVVGYWDYLAATRRLEVFRASEARSQRTADQTRILVGAEERTAAELTQILGNLATKRVTRIAAEQTVVEARQLLGLAMGLAAEEIATLPPPATDFPALADRRGSGAAADLMQGAWARRADLAAAEQDLRAAETLLRAAENEMKPRLDLVVGTGYNAAASGRSFADFLEPLYPADRKLNGSVSFRYDFPFANSRARGHMLQNASVYNQQRLFRDDLQRRILSGVTVAVEALARGEAGMRESEEAVRLLESTVQAEQRKFQLGVSTLFNVIQAEDQLTTGLLGRIQSQRNYAVAIAVLRFESGTLLSDQQGQATVDARSLETPP